MSFIELTRRSNGGPVTVAVDHIVSLLKHDRGPGTDIVPSTGFGHIEVAESYDEVRRLIGLDWLTCGENFQGDICDRRLDAQGRCPIHGLVGA